MIRQDILQKFPDLFGTKKVNGREVHTVWRKHCTCYCRCSTRTSKSSGRAFIALTLRAGSLLDRVHKLHSRRVSSAQRHRPNELLGRQIVEATPRLCLVQTELGRNFARHDDHMQPMLAVSVIERSLDLVARFLV